MQTIGFYPGSFDPFTVGHLEIVKKAAKLFDIVYVGIGVNPDKKRYIDTAIMKFAMEATIRSCKLTNVRVCVYNTLTSEYAKQINATHIIRGIRNNIDYNYEETLAGINEKLNSDVDTVYLRAGKYGCISSSVVKEILKYSKPVAIKEYVPEHVYVEIVIKEKKEEEQK